jgi:Amt family ammonium transporter
MPEAQKAVLGLQAGADVLLLLVGAVLALTMHAAFAFLEAGTVRHKSQANALCKALVGLAVSAVAYFFIGYAIAYGVRFLVGARELSAGLGVLGPQALGLGKFVILCALAAAVPAIISGGIAERARFLPHCVAAALIAGILYPLLEGIVWNGNLGLQGRLQSWFGEPFHDYAGSVVVHVMGGWLAFSAIRRLGPRLGRAETAGTLGTAPPSLNWVALGTWLFCIAWLGLAVVSAHSVRDVTGLVAGNALMALCGGILAAAIAGDADPGFIHNGALAGLIAVCAGADVMHPVGALLVGGVAGMILVWGVQAAAEPSRQFDDARGVWALHGLCGLWGGIACGIFGLASFGGMGGVSFRAQVLGSLLAALYALVAGGILYAVVDVFLGLRLSDDDERRGADLSVHRFAADADAEARPGRA